MKKVLLLTLLALAATRPSAAGAAAGRASIDPLAYLRLLTTATHNLYNDTQTGHANVMTDLGVLNTDSLGLLVPSKHDSEAVAVKADIAKTQKDLAALQAVNRADQKKLLVLIRTVNKDKAAKAQLGAMLGEATQQLASSNATVKDAATQAAAAVAKAWNPVLPKTDPNAPTPAPGLTG